MSNEALTAEALATHIAALLLTNSLESVIEALAVYTETYINDGLLGIPPEHITKAGQRIVQHLRTLKQLAQVIDTDDFGVTT